MEEFTKRAEIEVALSYLQRVRSMLPSPTAMRELARQERDLRQQLRDLDDARLAEPTTRS